jgi:hypothetical protein
MKTFKEFVFEEEEETNTEIIYPNGVYIATKLDESSEILIKEYK